MRPVYPRCPIIPIALLACSEPVRPPVAYEFEVVASDVWSGGELTIIAPGLTPDGPSFEVFLDNVALDVRQPLATTIVAQLPDLPGEHRLTGSIPGGTVTITPDLVRLHGFRDVFEGPPLKGRPHLWPGGGRSRVLAAGSNGLVQYDLGTRLVVQSWPDSIHGPACNWGIGPSWRANHFVMQGALPAGGCGPLRSWQVSPAMLPVDSATPPVTPAFGIAEIAAGRWLAAIDEGVDVIECAAGTCEWSRLQYEYADDPVISPRGDRVMLNGLHWQAGPLVLDAATGDTAYRVTPLARVVTSAFSAGGDTLYLVGSGGQARATAAALHALDGAVLAVTELESPAEAGQDGDIDDWALGLALDPAAPRLYVAAKERAGSLERPVLFVMDATTLEVVARLAAPPETPLPIPFVVASPADSAVYVVIPDGASGAPTKPLRVYRFDRLPSGSQ